MQLVKVLEMNLWTNIHSSQFFVRWLLTFYTFRWSERNKAKLTILCRRHCPFIRVCANLLSTFKKVFNETSTRKRSGKIYWSTNQRCPPFIATIYWREYCYTVIFLFYSAILEAIYRWGETLAIESSPLYCC